MSRSNHPSPPTGIEQAIAGSFGAVCPCTPLARYNPPSTFKTALWSDGRNVRIFLFER